MALITGFQVSTPIFASGLATLCFILITGKKIPLYYGSSFSYLTAVMSLMASESITAKLSPDALAQLEAFMGGATSVMPGEAISYAPVSYTHLYSTARRPCSTAAKFSGAMVRTSSSRRSLEMRAMTGSGSCSLSLIHVFLGNVMERNTMLCAVASSQVISNVPAAVLLSNFTRDAKGMLLGTNIGGLGTLVASLASLISFKLYARTPQAKLLPYLGIFTAANAAMLVLLYLLAAICL